MSQAMSGYIIQASLFDFFSQNEWIIDAINSFVSAVIGATVAYIIFRKQLKLSKEDSNKQLLDDITQLLDQYKSNYISSLSHFIELKKISPNSLGLENPYFKSFISHNGNISTLTSRFSGFQAKLRNRGLQNLSISLNDLAKTGTDQIESMHNFILQQNNTINSFALNSQENDPVLISLENCFKNIERIYPK